MQVDPAGYTSGANLYRHVANDPLNLVDAMGLSPDSPEATNGWVATAQGWLQTAVSAWNTGMMSQYEAESAGTQAQVQLAQEHPYAYWGTLAAITAPLAVLALPDVAAAGGATELGDLTVSEVSQIRSVVDAAGRPLDVVGSAARAARTATSDIDYTTANANFGNFEGLEGQLPGVDPEHGILRGYADPNIGPSIRFEPGSAPYHVPGAP